MRRIGGKLGKDFDRLEADWNALTAPDRSAGEQLADAIASGADATSWAGCGPPP